MTGPSVEFHGRKSALDPLEHALLTADDGSISVLGVQQLDSTGTEAWKLYLTGAELLDAWSTPPDSPYAQFVKTKTIESCLDILDQRKKVKKN